MPTTPWLFMSHNGAPEKPCSRAQPACGLVRTWRGVTSRPAPTGSASRVRRMLTCQGGRSQVTDTASLRRVLVGPAPVDPDVEVPFQGRLRDHHTGLRVELHPELDLV